MIDFDSQKYHGRSVFDRDKEECKKNLQFVMDQINLCKSSKYDLGLALIEFWKSQSYRVYCFNARESLGCGYLSNCHPTVFFWVCQTRFDLSKSEVSRYMNVVDEFGNGRSGFIPRWSAYSWSALEELLPLTEQERDKVESTWTIKQIREYKKQLKEEKIDFDALDNAVATSQQSEDDEPQSFEEFALENRSKDELVKMCNNYRLQLEAAYDYIAELKEKLAKYEELDKYAEEILSEDILNEQLRDLKSELGKAS